MYKEIKSYHFLHLKAVEENGNLWLEVSISRNKKYGQLVKFKGCQLANDAYERVRAEIRHLLYKGFTVSQAYEIMAKEKFFIIAKIGGK